MRGTMRGTITLQGTNKLGYPYGLIESAGKKYYFDGRNLQNGITMGGLSIGDWVEFDASKANNSSDIAINVNPISRTGLFVIGNLCNSKTCFSEITQKSKQLVDSTTLDSYVEQIWNGGNNGILCYDENLKQADTNSNKIAYFLIALGDKYKDEENKQLYEGYIKGIPSALKEHISINQGICVDTQENCLQKLLRYPYEVCKKNISDTINYLSRQEQDDDTNQKLVIQSLDKAIKDGTFYTQNNNKKWISFFKLDGIKTLEGDDIFITSIKTIKTKVLAYSREDLKDEILSLIRYHIGNLEFDDSCAAKKFFEQLAHEAMRENWGFNNSVLKSYLEHTYSRLIMEDKELEDKKKIKDLVSDENGISLDEKRKIFNSGLLNEFFRPIFISGKVSKFKIGFGTECFEWELLKDLKIHSSYDSIIIRNFLREPEPAMASYFESTDQVIFNSKLPIYLNDKHIFDDGFKNSRMSKKYQDQYDSVKNDKDKMDKFITKISGEFDTAVKRVQLMAERNYKLALPQFFRTKDDMQFLLPIYLSGNSDIQPDCALAVSLEKQIDPKTQEITQYYVGKTILTLDMAYNNARLIAKPDIFWLDPSWLKASKDESDNDD